MEVVVALFPSLQSVDQELSVLLKLVMMATQLVGTDVLVVAPYKLDIIALGNHLYVLLSVEISQS